MFKKMLSLMVLLIMSLSIVSAGFVCLAETSDLVERNLILNGDMEWLGTSYGCWSGTHDPETEIVHGGGKSMELTVDASRSMYTQSGSGILPGQTYTFSYWIYAEETFENTYVLNGSVQNSGAAAKVEITGITVDSSGNEKTTTVASGYDIYNPSGDELGTWIQRTVSVTAPDSDTKYATGTFSIHIRPQGTGTAWYDDMSLTGLVSAGTAATLDAKIARYQEGYDIGQALYDEYYNYANSATLDAGAINIIKNPGFETVDTNWNAQTTSGKSGRYDNGEYYWTNAKGNIEKFSGAQGWSRSNYMQQQKDNPDFADLNITEADYEVIYRDETVSRTDEYSMKIHVPDTYVAYNDPYSMHVVYSGESNCGEDFVGGAEYILSAWVKMENVGVNEGAYFKIQCNGASTTAFGTQESYFTDEQWHQVKYVFTMPENTTSLYIYIRLSGSGTVWYDDIELGRSSSNDYIEFDTKHTFYYTEESDIEAWADFKTNIYDIESGSKVKFSLLDENENLVSSQTVTAAESNTCKFATSLLANEQAKYILKAEYILSDGTVMDTHSKRIYRFDRPTSMDKDGNIYDVETGEVVPPFFMYGASYANHEAIANAGLTVIRTNISLNDDDDIQLKLDDAYSKGMKVLFALYGTVAGHPSQIVRTREVVSKFYTHPAIAAWMLMDEPNLHVSPFGIRTYDEMLYYLEEGYKAVRAIDNIHPVYNIETTGSPDSYERTGQMCDIFAIDPYPGSLAGSIGGSLSRLTTRAINAVYDERPVWVLGMAASWSSYGQPINSAMLRYQIYDALWTGAKGAGHYLSDDPNYTNPTFTETFLETFKQANASGEIDEIFDHFSLGNSPTWVEGSGNGYEWESWYKDNGDIYLAVRSKISSENTVLDTLTTDLKLISSNGKISIDGFDAVLVNGVSEKNISSATNEFAMTLTAGEVSLYKITPAENIDFTILDVEAGEIKPMDYGAELISDGTYENGLGSFFTSSNASELLSSANPGNGSASLQLVPSGSDDISYKSSNISVESGKSYELSFMMKTSTLTAESAAPVAKLITGYGTLTYSLYNSHLNNGEWKLYEKVFTIPDGALACKLEFILPAACGDVFLDDISFRQVTAYNEEQLITNLSFEEFSSNSSYTNANGTYPTGWSTSSTTYANIYIADDSVIAPHSGNYSAGIKSAVLQQSVADVKYGKTYEFSVWFNAANMVDETTYPHLTIQTRNSSGKYADGSTTKREYFKDSYLNKDKGWYKLTAVYTVPEYQDGYDIKSAVVTLNVAGDAIGYFDDASFRLIGEKEGYRLWNLETSSDDTSVTVEYDVTNLFTEDGGTVIYVFYDAEGRFVKMEKETAAFDSIHISRTFDKVDFASMKVFIWDDLGGLIPYSNAIE